MVLLWRTPAKISARSFRFLPAATAVAELASMEFVIDEVEINGK